MAVYRAVFTKWVNSALIRGYYAFYLRRHGVIMLLYYDRKAAALHFMRLHKSFAENNYE